MAKGTVFQEIRPGSGVKTGDFGKEKGVGGATVERHVAAFTTQRLTQRLPPSWPWNSLVTSRRKPAPPWHLVPYRFCISLHPTRWRGGLNAGAIDPPSITTAMMTTADDLWVPAESLSRTQEKAVLSYFDEGGRDNNLDL